ncbi:MAG TPA: penicillin-binding protein 2 [Verrucomicrobiae bacterium]|jgi:penicillin-binding protein 2|nr:penicillin-binding protein 2 [Verrucomicrobiae bacterium]
MTPYLDGRPTPSRPGSRFLVFGIAAILAIGGLTTRLFYLQIVNGGQFAALTQTNREVVQAIPSSRGLIYDRAGRVLVKNVLTYAVKIRPVDLPEQKRDDVVARLSGLLKMSIGDINAAIDGNPGSSFDLVRIASDVPEATSQLISESGDSLPGVEVVTEARRQYPDGPLVSQILGYTGPVSAGQLESLSKQGYLPDDLIGKTGLEAFYETQLRGTYGSETVERDASGRKLQVLETTRQEQAGDSLKLTIDVKEQQYAQKALQWGMRAAGLKRGVVIVMNPQTGEVLAMVSLPTYDDNAFARGISAKDYAKLLKDKNKPLLNHAVQAHYPPGSTYKLVAGSGALADNKISATSLVQTRGYLLLGRTKFWEWNHRGWGAISIKLGFAHSSDTFFFQVAGMLGIERLAHWAHQYGFGAPTGIDLPGEVAGIVPNNAWKQEQFGEQIYPGETYQAGIGQGYDVVTPIQLINAYAALANGGKLYQPQIVREIIGPDGSVVRPFAPKLIRRVGVPRSDLTTMRQAARNVLLVRHTYNLVDLPIVIAGKSGTAEFGIRDSKGRLPFHSWFVAFVPKHAAKTADDPTGMKAISREDSNLVVLAFAYDSRTKGNAATEIVKYYLQLHFHIKHDYRNFYLLQRGNFYQSN